MNVDYECPTCGHPASLPDYVAAAIDHPGTTFFISCSHKDRATTARPARMRRKEGHEAHQSPKEEATA